MPHLLHRLNLQRKNLERNLERNHPLRAQNHPRKLQRNLPTSNSSSHSQVKLPLRVLKKQNNLPKKPKPQPELLPLQPRKPLFQQRKPHQKPKVQLYKLSKQRKLQQKHKLKHRKLLPLLKPLKQKQEKLTRKLLSLPKKQKPLKKQQKQQLKKHNYQSQELKVLKKQPLFPLRKPLSQLNSPNKLEVPQVKQKNLLNKQQNQQRKHKLPLKLIRVLKINQLLHWKQQKVKLSLLLKRQPHLLKKLKPHLKVLQQFQRKQFLPLHPQ